ncbi:MAG: glycoside hydrolase family 16 protein [Bacteroidia bacterium]|nr:glycoside hydrolase family 16 protein [Bacteroidia bacterium]
MKQLLFLLLVCFASKIALGQKALYPCQGGQAAILIEDAQCNINPWQLVFEDNFDGTSLDTTKWEIQPWGQGTLQGDPSNQYYSLGNIIVENGTCKITAIRETVVRRAVSYMNDTVKLDDGLPNLRTYDYTSSNIWTLQKFGYGKFEIRCKIPKGKGFWPAFWLFGAPYGRYNEVDIFEFWNEDDYSLFSRVVHMNVHYPTGDDMCQSTFVGSDFSKDFHTFTFIYDNYKLEWYVDGELKRRITKFYTLLGQAVDCNSLHIWHEYVVKSIYPRDPMTVILNLALQSGDGSPNGKTPFPSFFEIDYVRVWQQ